MKILVLNGSARANGGTAAMVHAFAQAARQQGHDVDVFNVATAEIHGCRGCEYCHTQGAGRCIQRDDMDALYPLWEAAEMIVFASPIYYGSISGQLACAIHRTYAGGIPRACKRTALFLCSGASDVYAGAEYIYNGFLRGYFGTQDCGVFEATTAQAKSPQMAQRLQRLAASL